MIILEQPDNSGKWKKIPPPLKGKIDTNKNDVSNDGNWYKPKEGVNNTPNPIDDAYEVITDSELLKKIKENSQDFLNKITTQVPSLSNKAGKWIYKKSEELEQWWENYKKQRQNSSSTEWLKDPTNSKMYVYKVKNCEWLAKNVKTGKIFNISDDSKYKSSVDILNKEYPQYLKNCNSSNTDNTQTTTPTPLPVVLPTWAKCIGDSIVDTNVTKDENGLEIVFSPFGKDMGYFWDDKTFTITYSNGVKVSGTWSCDGNKLFIKTTDGQQWSKDTEWIAQPSGSINPNVNYQTTGVDATKVMTNDSIPTPDMNESVYLEDVLNNVNTLINEIDMKSRIMEQSKPLVVVAPAQELDILYNHAILKNIGSVQTLCNGRNGTAIPVNVNGRVYFAGRRGKLTPALGGGEGFITYDGKVLKNTGGCNYTYVLKDDNIVTMDGIDQIELQLPQKELLSRFGIDGVDYNSDPYSFIDNITTKFQSLIDKGARSMIFKSWSDLLKNYYKYGPQEKWLKITDQKSITNPPKDELNRYQPMDADNLGIKYLDKQIIIYQPLGRGTTSRFEEIQYNSDECRSDLVSYISAAFRFNQNGSVDRNVGSAPVRNNIKGCYAAGQYQKMKPINSTDDIKIQFNDKNNPFMGLRGFGDDLDIKEIQKLLGGETFKLPKVGPYGKNPFLPFNIDPRQNMNESKLTGLIKENLLKVSKQKNESLLIEKKIVQTRTKLISENRILKFKQPREKFFNEIISEAIYFEKQGFNKQIIKEEFWDSMKGLFGEHGSSAIFSTFKEYMGKHLVEKLTSINPNGWMGQNIKKAINTIHIEDIDKIVDCNFITKKVSSSISEAIINKISQGQDIEGGGIGSIVKGGLDKSIDRTELNKNIHDGISKLICPVLGDVSKKLKEKGEEMKLKAVRP